MNIQKLISLSVCLSLSLFQRRYTILTNEVLAKLAMPPALSFLLPPRLLRLLSLLLIFFAEESLWRRFEDALTLSLLAIELVGLGEGGALMATICLTTSPPRLPLL